MKELNVRIVDLETKAYANASKLKGEALRQTRTGGDRPQSRASTGAETERTRSRLEEEVKSYETKIAEMREAMAQLVKLIHFGRSVCAQNIISRRKRATYR